MTSDLQPREDGGAFLNTAEARRKSSQRWTQPRCLLPSSEMNGLHVALIRHNSI